jgi:hypothetical protein
VPSSFFWVCPKRDGKQDSRQAAIRRQFSCRSQPAIWFQLTKTRLTIYRSTMSIGQGASKPGVETAELLSLVVRMGEADCWLHRAPRPVISSR